MSGQSGISSGQVAERRWKLARNGGSGKWQMPFRPEGTKETASICRQMISPRRFHRPFRTASFLPRYQTLRVWLISGCAFGTSHMRLRLELFHGLDATPANRRVFGILADVHFPMPAALAFLPILIYPVETKLDTRFPRLTTYRKNQIRYSNQFLKTILPFYQWRK